MYSTARVDNNTNNNMAEMSATGMCRDDGVFNSLVRVKWERSLLTCFVVLTYGLVGIAFGFSRKYITHCLLSPWACLFSPLLVFSPLHDIYMCYKPIACMFSP